MRIATLFPFVLAGLAMGIHFLPFLFSSLTWTILVSAHPGEEHEHASGAELARREVCTFIFVDVEISAYQTYFFFSSKPTNDTYKPGNARQPSRHLRNNA
jgi:hypothetical protein